MVNQLQFRDFVSKGAWIHIGRLEMERAGAMSSHTHDFAEVFWIERGTGVHAINGQRLPLAAGQLWLIRPSDVHGFSTRSAEGFTMVNVAFPASALAPIQKRYFSDSAWPWKGAKLPAHFSVSPGQMARLHDWSDALAAGELSRLELDWFLLNLMHILTAPGSTNRQADRPQWLEDALRKFELPEHFSRGPLELARLAERCPEHLNRVVRKCFGKTTTDLVNDIRLEYAGKQLRMTNRPILDLAFDCGLENLGYFYRLFYRRFGMTPRQFRLQKDAVVR